MLKHGYDIRCMTPGDTLQAYITPYDADALQTYARSVGLVTQRQMNDGERQRRQGVETEGAELCVLTCVRYREVRDWPFGREVPTLSQLSRSAPGELMQHLRQGDSDYVNGQGLSLTVLRAYASHVASGTHTRFTVRRWQYRKGWLSVKRLVDHPHHEDAKPFDRVPDTR